MDLIYHGLAPFLHLIFLLLKGVGVFFLIGAAVNYYKSTKRYQPKEPSKFSSRRK